MGTPTPFDIEELTGGKHKLRLVGRALPYRPLTFEGSMRAEFTWYPGNPVATVQMLGSQEGSTSINGMWKDRFLKSMTDPIGPIPALPVQGRQGSAYYDGNLLIDVYDLVRIVDSFRRRGQLLKVTWDEFVRHGIMTKFRHSWLRREDVEWEMDFQWISQGDPIIPVAFALDLDILGMVNQIAGLVNDLVSVVQAGFALVNSMVNAINTIIDTITQAVASLMDIAKQAVKALLSPLEVARAVKAGFQTLAGQGRELARVVDSLPAKAIQLSHEAGLISQAQAEKASKWVSDVKISARRLVSEVILHKDKIDANQDKQSQPKIVTARENQNLRDLTTRYYGTPHEWKRVRQYNRASGSKLRSGRRVYLPRRLPSQGRLAGGT